jgi:hypothetical protein
MTTHCRHNADTEDCAFLALLTKTGTAELTEIIHTFKFHNGTKC